MARIAIIGSIEVPELPVDGRQSPMALAIRRGAGRALYQHGFVVVPELVLPGGRRADLAAIGAKGEIWIVEIKSSVVDFQVDGKWPSYRAHCDRLFFAVAPDFPAEILPPDTGLIVADAYGGALVREAPEHRLGTVARKAMTFLLARTASARLHQAMDPDGILADFL
ncbi:MmcB family DNA repair protein [Labrys wisconsinensis]|uniref:DNA repair protein MmcB-related protein n=1 Tax=Labrys wisconsinensis TaxID=425677 RepID=A0ABU0JDN5_9HYPH|nr:MmcB family DNA repair protein [Labrys wisconsinensis]MDQ0472371.1 hypothetical protein [Labrys wisconsinensis]